MKKSGIILLLALIIDITMMVYSMAYGPYPPTLPKGDPTSYRIAYIHIPMSVVSYVAFGSACIASILYLAKKSDRYDSLALISATLGLLYGIGSILSGAVWSAEIWGAAWNWDPRQTSTLTMWLAYLGYLALRSSIGEQERMRVMSSVYAIAVVATIPFSYFSAIYFQSLHAMLPQQPIGPVGSAIIGVRVIAAILSFLSIEIFYYKERLTKTVQGER